MANTNSINKVREYLEQQNQSVSLSEIALENGLSNKAVSEVLEILKLYLNIQIMTNGNTTLVQLKKVENGANTI